MAGRAVLLAPPELGVGVFLASKRQHTQVAVVLLSPFQPWLLTLVEDLVTPWGYHAGRNFSSDN